MKRTVSVGMLALSLGVLAGCPSGVTDKDVTDNQISLVDTQKLWAKRGDKSLILIDMEMPSTYQQGHIPGSVNMPWTDFPDSLEKRNEVDPRITAYDNVIAYGQNRAPGPVWAGAKRMIAAGYSIQVFLGGMEEWKAAGLPVDKGPGRKWSEEPRGQLK